MGPNDEWSAISGRSAAAPQIAGLAAQLLAAKPELRPYQVAEAMSRTTLDVTNGCYHPRFSFRTTVGDDSATGAAPSGNRRFEVRRRHVLRTGQQCLSKFP